MLVVETLKGGLLHSIGVMIVYVFVLHLSHTCLFNFFILGPRLDRWARIQLGPVHFGEIS